MFTHFKALVTALTILGLLGACTRGGPALYRAVSETNITVAELQVAGLEASKVLPISERSTFIADLTNNMASSVNSGALTLDAYWRQNFALMNAFSNSLGQFGYGLAQVGAAAYTWEIVRKNELPTQTIRREGDPETINTTTLTATGGAGGQSISISDAFADGSARLTVKDGAFQVSSEAYTGPITLTQEQAAKLANHNIVNVGGDEIAITNTLTGAPVCGMGNMPNCPMTGGGGRID